MEGLRDQVSLKALYCVLWQDNLSSAYSDRPIHAWLKEYYLGHKESNQTKNEHYEPWSDCFYGSSLIWVHIIFNIGYLNKQMSEQMTFVLKDGKTIKCMLSFIPELMKGWFSHFVHKSESLAKILMKPKGSQQQLLCR